MSAEGEVPQAAEAAIAGVLIACSLIAFGLMRLTTRSAEGDFFDSPGYWLTWLLFPALALVATLFRPTPRTALVAASALLGPLMAILFVLGTVGHDPSDGASFWVVGEILLAIEGLLTVFGGLVAVVLAKAASLRRDR